MLMSIPFTTLVVLVSTCGSIMGAPGQPQNAKMTRRQTNTAAVSQNGGMKSMAPGGTPTKMTSMGGANGGSAEMSGLEKEAKEATEEKKLGVNTIADSIKELYFHDKFGSQKHDTATLVKMVGQVAATNAKTCDPETVSKAIMAIFEPYNQGKSAAPASKGPSDDAAPSLNTIAHSLHETWEKQITSGNPKVENPQLLPIICQTIATSSSSGDPTVVSKAIESAYAKLAAN